MQEQFDIPLAPLTTMHVGGPARRLVVAETIDEIVDAVRETDDAGEPLLVLSGGSNLLIADEGFPGTVVNIANQGLEIEHDSDCGGVTVRVGAGVVWDDFVREACERDWSGIEALSGIPGLVGATPVQNVGAYGQEVAQTISSVRTYDRVTQQIKTFANADCEFTYRHSIFKSTPYRDSDKSGRYVVLDVSFQLRKADRSQPIAYADLAAGLGVEQGERVPLADARAGVLAQRAKRGMVLEAGDHDTWSCGSFFTNPIVTREQMDSIVARAEERLGADGPVPPQFPAGAAHPDMLKTSAAWLIDKGGFGKGYNMPGPAALSTKHTLALTNRGTATAADVAALARVVVDGVEEAFGVRLVPEPVWVGLTL